VPVAGQGDRDHGLGQQGEGGEDGDQDHRRPSPVQQPVADRGQQVQGDPGHGQDGQRAPAGLLGKGRVQRRQPEQRHHAPGDHDRGQAAPEQGLAAQHGLGPLRGQVQGGEGGEHGRQQQPDRGGDGEPGVAPVENHLRRGQGVQQQEPGAGQEDQRHQEQAGVAPVA
jgi:hypothetical protein